MYVEEHYMNQSFDIMYAFDRHKHPVHWYRKRLQNVQNGCYLQNKQAYGIGHNCTFLHNANVWFQVLG